MGRNIERLKIMLVSLPPNFNQSKKINSLKFSQRTNYIIPMKKDSVSFGDGGMSLIYLVAKYGAVEGLKMVLNIIHILILKEHVGPFLLSQTHILTS